MRMSLEDEIREIVKEMLKGLSSVMLFEKDDKKRFQDVLKAMEENKEIFGFIPKPNKKFKDFAVIVENKGRYDTVGVAIKKTKKEGGEYMRRQDRLREQISQYRKFIERIVLVVDKKTTDANLKRQWQKAIKQYQES